MNHELLVQASNVPNSDRDVQWEYSFLDALPLGKVKVLSPEPQNGPDGWPYMMVEAGEDATEPAWKIIQWLAQRGIGLVVNPSKAYPDFVFNFGMLWYFKENGRFVQTSAPNNDGNIDKGLVEIEGAGLHTGEPTKEYLPDYVRQILREFFRDQGLHAVRIAMVSADRKNYDLAFSVESIGNPPQAEHAGIAEAMAWFLPGHYSVLVMSEAGVPGFVAL